MKNPIDELANMMVRTDSFTEFIAGYAILMILFVGTPFACIAIALMINHVLGM